MTFKIINVQIFLTEEKRGQKKFIIFFPFGRNSKSFEQLKDSFGRINISFEVRERERERERERGLIDLELECTIRFLSRIYLLINY